MVSILKVVMVFLEVICFNVIVMRKQKIVGNNQLRVIMVIMYFDVMKDIYLKGIIMVMQWLVVRMYRFVNEEYVK